MRYAIITAIGLAIIGLMFASYASITPPPVAYQSQDITPEYEPALTPRCHDVQNCDGYVESIPK